MNLLAQLSDRDRRALSLLTVALALAGFVYYWPDLSTPSAGDGAPTTDEEIELTQQRRLRLQQIVSTLPARRDLVAKAETDLKQREQGLIIADTAAQAQAQLVQIVRQVGRAQNPPIDVRGTELGRVAPLGEHYGTVSAAIQLECKIEDLVNFLADLTRQKELLSTADLRVTATQSKQKTISVRLSVLGVIPKRLLPDKEKKGASSLLP